MPTIKPSELVELIEDEEQVKVAKFRIRSEKERKIEKERKKRFNKHLD